MNKIIYVQANEEIAKTFQEKFAENDIEMIHAKSGEEALEIISKEKVLLLLIDIKIPDMRLRKFVDRIREALPQVILNVCVDVLDPLMITKLANRHHIHKIYAAPWDVDMIIEELKESLEVALINENINVKEDRVISEKAELEETLTSLKTTLKKQQFSYSKISELTDCFVESLVEEKESDMGAMSRLEFAIDVYLAILRMHTTGTFDIEKFERDIKKDLDNIKIYNSICKTGEISSCLFGGQSRSCAQNIRFCIYLIARLSSQFYDDFTVDVNSHYITTREAEFCISVTINTDHKKTDEDMRLYYEYVSKIILDMTTAYRENIDKNVISYYCTFRVNRE